LIDKEKNLFSGKRSDILALFDIGGKSYAKVTYNSPPQQVLPDCATDSFVNSITFSVKDDNGDLFDFNGLPFEFKSEIN